jgi:hypothetical protein
MVFVCTTTERSAKTAMLDKNLAATTRMRFIVNLLPAGGDPDRGAVLGTWSPNRRGSRLSPWPAPHA